MSSLPRSSWVTSADPFVAQSFRVLIWKQKDRAGKAAGLRAAASREGGCAGKGPGAGSAQDGQGAQ